MKFQSDYECKAFCSNAKIMSGTVKSNSRKLRSTQSLGISTIAMESSAHPRFPGKYEKCMSQHPIDAPRNHALCNHKNLKQISTMEPATPQIVTKYKQIKRITWRITISVRSIFYLAFIAFVPLRIRRCTMLRKNPIHHFNWTPAISGPILECNIQQSSTHRDPSSHSILIAGEKCA